uniref:Uncharacterized protein n=1 Tax=Gallus gallus TaxID=9031 RepID=A0A8V0Y001_CHICK
LSPCSRLRNRVKPWPCCGHFHTLRASGELNSVYPICYLDKEVPFFQVQEEVDRVLNSKSCTSLAPSSS